MASRELISGQRVLRRVLPGGTKRVASQAAHINFVFSSFREQYLVQFTVFLLAYCIAGKLGQATTSIRSSNLGPVWPAFGIALAAFLVCGNRIWPAILSGAFLIAFFSPVSHMAALGQAAGATLAVFSGSSLLRVAGFDNSLSHLRDVLALLILGALGSAVVSASIGVTVLYATHVHPYSGLGSAWLIYWLGDATGVLLVTPLVLTFPDFLRSRKQIPITEFAVLFLLLTSACLLIFGDPSLVPVRLHVLAFAVLPFVMWAAIRFGVSGASLSILLIATIATVETAFGSGPFAISTAFTNAVLLDAFFAVLSITGLSLASSIAEREQADRAREQSIREQGALEVRLGAEQAVRASEERLRLAQQAARIGTFEWNIRTGVNTWTPELEAIYGLQTGDFGGTQTAFENLIHPSDRTRVIELVDSALASGQPTQAEWRVIWPDGSVHWIAGHWRVFINEAGEPSRMVGVNMDVTERKSGEDKLREYERAVEGVEELIVVIDREYRCLMANRAYLKRRDVPSAQIVGRFVHEFVDKEIYEGIIKPKLDECFKGKVVRYELQYTYPHLGDRDLLASYYPVEGKNGVDRAACILHDITDRKQAEQALAGMSRKLIEAQEQERARIGRELHDDINQKLAMLAVEIEQLQHDPSDMHSRSQELRKQVADISDDVQALSHELHPAKLEYLGVVAGMRSWCRELAERQGLEINFRADVATALPPQIGVTLFRVLQEALHNATKHSGIKRVEIQFLEYPGEVHLTISDAGKGFEIERARQGKGLGLTTMEERVRLVNGTIVIESKPMIGTRIHVRVPLDAKHNAERQAV